MCDDDRDGDGVVNSADFLPNNPNETNDNDNDRIGDNRDADDDNDGFSDDIEIALNTNPLSSSSVPNLSAANDLLNFDNSTSNTYTFSEYITANPKYSLFNKLVKSTVTRDNTPIAKKLDALTTATFLIPNNDALKYSLRIMKKAGFVSDTNRDGLVDIKDITLNKDFARSFVLYHVQSNDYRDGFINVFNKKMQNLAQLPLTIDANGDILTQFVQYDQLINNAKTAHAKVEGNVSVLKKGVLYEISQALLPPTLRIDQLIHQGKDVYQQRCHRDNGFKALPQISEFAKIYRNALYCDIRSGTETYEFLSINPPQPFTLPAPKTSPYTSVLPNNTATSAQCKEFQTYADNFFQNGKCNESWMFGPFRGLFFELIDTNKYGFKEILFSGELTGVTGNFDHKDIIASDGVIHILDSMQ